MTGPAGVPGRRTYGLTIETLGLTKRFGEQVAVDSLDLAVPSGAVFGFLGPNGSGKTTTIRMLLGLAAASEGTVRLLGKEMPGSFQDVLPRVGALVEGPAFYPFLSGTANLHRLDAAGRHADPATRRERVGLALERVGLGHAAGKRVHAYSLGMKQRLGIANALLSPRELLVLDEPTNGLDPQGTREVRNLVRSLAADGTTVFVSSHLLAEVEQICTHAAVMSAGRLVAQGPLAELRRSGSSRLRLVTPDAGPASSVLATLGLSPETGAGQPDGDVVLAALATPGFPPEAGAGRPAPEDIVAELVKAGVRVRGFAVERESLEDRFVELTGEGFDVAQ
ncbi:ABC transporter ATP-binding protein [Pseudarthrobacter polychromogenes]|uniref:ABC transporter ATP-binding protein n=1 Tax=Pseudarthrobacter polychromogenes TaxID=1676 RepID=A0ABQ1XJU9_9MICC|nr:ABC transporter ATP-binding protein [Pseudarthrobacter polychromogenes]GGG95631.1 ABC transporter ATP-binding protein [Pseudarthrobacter polychromogenes]